jgi:hypothetical protein
MVLTGLVGDGEHDLAGATPILQVLEGCPSVGQGIGTANRYLDLTGGDESGEFAELISTGLDEIPHRRDVSGGTLEE